MANQAGHRGNSHLPTLYQSTRSAHNKCGRQHQSAMENRRIRNGQYAAPQATFVTNRANIHALAKRFLPIRSWKIPLSNRRWPCEALFNVPCGRSSRGTLHPGPSAKCHGIFFRYVLEKDLGSIQDAVRARKRLRLPVVLTQQEVAGLLGHLHGISLLMAPNPVWWRPSLERVHQSQGERHRF